MIKTILMLHWEEKDQIIVRLFAYAINAESLTIWKDVEGLLNGDPKYFKNTKLIKNISYSEAIELAFYGASVIHPKTLQPVQKKEIPLYIKSFEKPNQKGTEINKNLDLSPKVPCYIFKNNMIFIKIFSLDFSFAIDKNLSHIFKKIDEFKMKVISFKILPLVFLFACLISIIKLII